MTPDGTHDARPRPHPPADRPVDVEGAEPGDILEVEILDVSPLVDFGYVTDQPGPRDVRHAAAGAARRVRRRTPRPSQLSDPSPGAGAGGDPRGPAVQQRGRLRAAVPLRARAEHRASPRSSAPTPAAGRGSRSRRSWASSATRRCARACTASFPPERQRRHGRQHRRPPARQGLAAAAAGLRRGRQVLRRRRAHGPGRRRDHRHGDRDADVGDAAVLGHQEHRHHLAARDRPGGRPDPARDDRRDARRRATTSPPGPGRT